MTQRRFEILQRNLLTISSVLQLNMREWMLYVIVIEWMLYVIIILKIVLESNERKQSVR